MSRRSRSPSVPRYRRAAHVVCYWDNGQLVLHNFASGIRAAAAPLTIDLLERCGDWRALPAIVRGFGLPDGVPLEPMLEMLVDATFLERSDRPASAAARAYATWGPWNPAAGFFHASTKDVPYAPPAAADDLLRKKGSTRRGPSMVTRVRAVAQVDLPPAAALGGLTETLTGRRTWRRFGPGRVSRADLATLLHLTWGIQRWMRVEGFGRMPLKTSPSGGARHSIEAYALVRRVAGVRPGLYHYGPDDHRLHRLASPPKAKARGRRTSKVSDYLPLQTWYDDAAVVVFMTAVFARAQWRYGYARAYRSILAEGGHLAQTFCLVATRLGLAPFCSMALADSRIEADLGLDGATESVVYAVGAGRRPKGVAWAPWPDTDAVPERSAPAWARGRPRTRRDPAR